MAEACEEGQAVACGYTLESTCTFQNSFSSVCGSHGLIINTSNVVLDCAGYSINGSNVDYGIYVNHAAGVQNVTIRNCNINNFENFLNFQKDVRAKLKAHGVNKIPTRKLVLLLKEKELGQ